MNDTALLHPPLMAVLPWLNNFLSERRNKNLVATPLYQYQMSSDEYLSLRQVLSNSFHVVKKSTFSKEWCAAFTLYGSEWFRREYSGDWSWQPIFKSLCFELTPSQISMIVPTGLVRYWRRPLSRFASNQNDYLGSMFREGGLPSNLLSCSGNHYKRAFFSIFERYQDAKDFGSESVEKLIRTRICILPETLQSDDSVALITNMVEQLDALVYQFSLDKQKDPAQYLDTQFPAWRESFPLPLESEIGSAFLSQLLSTASKEVRKVATVKRDLACKHMISFANQSIVTDITLPNSCTFNGLTQRQLKTSRIELAIFEDDDQIASLGTGFAHFEENGSTSIRIRMKAVEVRRYNPASELYIVAMQAGCKLANIRIILSAIDVGDSPISLLDKGDKWQILSQSSLTTKYEKVGILCSSSMKFNVEYGELASSDLSFQGYQVRILNGKCECICNQDERYLITTSSDDFKTGNFELKGEQVEWKSTPALVFKGIPSVRLDNAYSEWQCKSDISIFLGNRNIDGLSASESNGRQLLIAKTSDGIIQLRKRIGILPRDFDIELVNGDTPSQGIIRVTTLSPCILNIDCEDVEVKTTSNKVSGYKEVNLNALGKIPSTVTMSVRANILSEPILIEVPFPARGAMAYNHEGNPLAHRLTVNDLLGSRLHLFSTKGTPANFQVEAVVRKLGHGNSNKPFYRWNYRVVDKPLDVSLYGLKDSILELLSLSEELDGQVELSVTGPGRTLNYTINHYSTILEYDRSQKTVSLRPTAKVNTDNMQPVLMSLSAPEQKPLPLISRQSEGVDTGEYELPALIDKDGPWLIVPDRSSTVSFRAKFFASDNSSLNDHEVKTLQKASQLYHPQYNPDVIAQVLHQMSADWEHSGWQYLKATYKNFGYLPLSTFEVWRHLVRDERALAVAVFVFENDAKFITHLEQELPIFWEFIDIEHWQHAASLMKDILEKKGITGEILKTVIHGHIEKLGQVIPALSDTVVNWLINESKPQSMPEPLIQMAVDNWYQDLLRVHCEDCQWPIEYGDELKQCCINMPLLPFHLNTNAKYQTGVVYLPLFAAAVASGVVPSLMINQFPKEAIFHLRKLRDFDREWFEPMYRCFISYFANTNQ
ncbi:STY4851/ECs_5259 family protein [Photobacterium leiognathi]|uniref:STY4851/ECs_5259 family protein n=1 Tax=Photobacterium leiognathi TaxID=553611 RepID=UPI002980A907|nr:STY4851/ECs_5259 family protein [Photobacterium leiognathi]